MVKQNHSGRGHNINANTVNIDNTLEITSELSNLINVLSKKIFFPDQSGNKKKNEVFNPEIKIRHNNVVRFKPIINEYKPYVGKISAIYKEFDSQSSNKTHIVLENIRLSYLKEKAKLLQNHPSQNEIFLIRNHADDLIENVEASLKEEILRSSNIEVSNEYINLSLQIILIDAFIKCKILEEPE